jgi:hypothetical protein
MLVMEHGTFEEYCRERWGMSRIHAYRLIESAAVVGNLLPIGTSLPTTESQARPLTTLPDDLQSIAIHLTQLPSCVVPSRMPLAAPVVIQNG